jgi:hypothetical protein
MGEGRIQSLINLKALSGMALAILLAIILSGAASAQSADDQYDEPVSPSGPAAGAECTSTDEAQGGQVDAGDTLVCEGDYEVADGASAVVQDSDGTQGTFVDNENAQITEGSIVIQVTGEPMNEVGGNGVLNTDCLFIAVTTGITGEEGQNDGVVECDAVAVDDTTQTETVQTGGVEAEAQPTSAGVSVLPDTGGPVLFGILGSVALLGGVMLAIRRRMSNT